MKLKMLFRIIVFICLSISLGNVNSFAQQRLLNSQYTFDGLLINPAYAGSHVQLSATMTHRNQWVNFDGSPITNIFSGHVGVLDNRIGIGLFIIDDKIGVHRELSAYGSYAYKIKFPGSTLSFGIQGGFTNRQSNFDRLTLLNINDPYFNQNVKLLKPNFGSGIYYTRKNLFAGFSVPYLINNDILEVNEGTVESVKEARNYYLTAGMLFPLNQTETIVFRPSFLLRVQEGSPINYDVTANLIFYDLVSVGNSYRNVEGLITFINIKIVDNLYMGYGYDWTQSDLNQFSNGTHEFMLNYRVRLRGVHKPVECPSYFSIR